MSELPIGWIKTTLGDVASQGQYGWTSKATDNGRVKYLRTTDITSGRINWDTVPYCQDNPPSVEKYKIESGDILISRAGSVGFSVLIQDIPSTPAVFASYLIRYIPNSEVNPKFIACFLQSPNYWRQISDASAGIALANVNAKKLADVVLPFAPFNEQKRIADKLDTLLTRVDSCQSHLERVPQILKRFRQSVLAAATSGRLTEEWREEKGVDGEWENYSLGDVLIDIRYGTARKSVYELKDGTPVLRIPNVVNGKVDASDLKFSHFDKKEIETLSLKADDLLLIRSNGSVELVGKVAIVDKEFEGFLYAGYLIRLRFDKGKVNPRYISHYLSSPAIRSHIELTARSTSGVNNINSEEVKAISLDLPSLEEQAEIVRRVETLFAFADRLEKRYGTSYALVEQLTPSLLAKAFRGELVEQDPNDEPASMLLERIRQTREADQASSTSKKPSRKKDRSTKEVRMLKLSEIQENHLSAILKERGRMTSEALWSASQLEIDDFYDQLKVEEAKGHLREIRSSDPDSPRMLEAT